MSVCQVHSQVLVEGSGRDNMGLNQQGVTRSPTVFMHRLYGFDILESVWKPDMSFMSHMCPLYVMHILKSLYSDNIELTH